MAWPWTTPRSRSGSPPRPGTALGSRSGTALRVVALVALLAATLIACSSGGPAHHAGASSTVWLCRPGGRPDPCNPGLSTTVYDPAWSRVLGVQHPTPQHPPPIDCFYVYPTVSDERSGNSDLTVQATERSIALYQVARYSQYCSVYAPMYRQVTLAGAGLSGGSSATSRADPALAVRDVENAFENYLQQFNHGRGFVLIGHSQGAGVLETLIADKVDNNPAVRKRLVSAILLGGNVLVKGDTGIGGDFQHIPACRNATQIGCVIAYSTFDQPVPADSLFGRPSSLQSLGKPAPAGDVVLCTNPANLAGGSGQLDMVQPSSPFAPGSSIAAGIALLGLRFPAPSTVFWSSPGAYRAQCEDSNGAQVLEITPVGGAQIPKPSPTPGFGLHLLDANVALGNLISIVSSQSRAYLHHG